MRAINIIFIIFGAFLNTFAYYNRKRIKPEAKLLIYVAGTSTIIFSLSTRLLGNLARLFGVGRGVDLVIYISIPILFYLLFLLYLRVEELNRKLTKIVREDAVKNATKKNK